MNRIKIVFWFVIIFSTFGVCQQKKNPKLFPVDEAIKDSSFLNFRNELLDAIEDKDKHFLLAILTENVKSSFGGDDNIKYFIRYWNLKSDSSNIWKEMKFILTHGGSFYNYGIDTMFIAPYVFSIWIDSIDAFSYVAVIDSNVILRSKPDLNSDTVTTLNFDVLRLKDNWYENENFIEVENYDDSFSGFVLKDKIRSPIDHRIGFIKKNKKWKIQFFVAGD